MGFDVFFECDTADFFDVLDGLRRSIYSGVIDITRWNGVGDPARRGPGLFQVAQMATLPNRERGNDDRLHARARCSCPGILDEI